MRTFLALLCLFFFCQASEAYTAIYTSPNLKDQWKKCHHKIDRIWSSESWDDLDLFLDKIKAESKGELIVLDFSVHGHDKSTLLSKYTESGEIYYASMGTVLNHLEQKLTGRKVVILFETCYGVNAFKSLSGNFPVHGKRYWIENHSPNLAYPIWGGAFHSNWCTLVFEEFIHHLENNRKPLFVRDLRLPYKEMLSSEEDNYPALEAVTLDFLRDLDQKR